MKLDIQPIVALCDQKLDIRVSDLPAHGKVKISASLCLPWAKDVLYESAAWFTADADGQVDLSRQKPDSGSYDFVDSMGLIVSVKSQDPKALEKIGHNITVNESISIAITAECGSDRASEKLERLMKLPEVKSHRITDGFVGELFYSGHPDNKTIVWLGGSGSECAHFSCIGVTWFQCPLVAVFWRGGVARPAFEDSARILRTSVYLAVEEPHHRRERNPDSGYVKRR
jgi:hypothetical protein